MSLSLLVVFALGLFQPSAHAQDETKSPAVLKTLSLEELMEIEVTTVSKRLEKLTETASAIQVITGEDIRRSGATTLPEALRLAPNVRVAQLNSYAWVISARGFSTLFSNKLLVMIDGRTVYTPLFAGVYWDTQNVLLEDIDRIEVVSGPGGTLWGANAVNGVINIITKSAMETEGIAFSAAAGTFLKDWASIRYGGSIHPNLSFRIYAQRFDRDNTTLATGADNTDRWGLTDGGFRLDWNPSELSALTVTGNFYASVLHTRPTNSTKDGQHILGRWTRTFSAQSNISVQAYFDRTWFRDIPSTFSDQLNTFDLDVQYRLPLHESHQILWGMGYRLMMDESANSTTARGFLPPNRNLQLFSGFIQDEVNLMDKVLRLTVGTKVEHNDYSGFEIQPNARLALTPSDNQTVWTALSRAVRSPSRIDVDFHIPAYKVPLGAPSVAGGPNFVSEKVLTFELGYRVQPVSTLSLSLATWYNWYDDLYSVEAVSGQTFQIQNGSEGESRGAEFTVAYQVNESWQLRGGYTYFHKDLRNKPGHSSNTSTLGNDPAHQGLLQSRINLFDQFQVDVLARYVDILPAPHLSSYLLFDVRIAWLAAGWEFSVVAQNLGDSRHLEFGTIEIPRTLYGKISLSL